MKKQEGYAQVGNLNLHYTAISHTGQVRKINEDDFLALPELATFCLADGMGGHNAGDVASKLALDSVAKYYQSKLASPSLEDAINFANATVHSHANGQTMGSTIVVARYTKEYLELAHVGDSRAYLWRGRQLKQLTLDHSLVTELFIKGEITAAEMRTHPRKNVITQAIGPYDTVKPSVQQVACQKGDLFILCSDGLTGMLDDNEIAQAIVTKKELADITELLVWKANDAGGHDNITVMLIAIT